MKAQRITRIALLSAIALTIFLVEAQIPSPIPIPGVKLGLANLVTVYALFVLGWADAGFILLTRIILGSIFSGTPSIFFYSLGGGLASFLLMWALTRVVTSKQMWVCGVAGGVAHNLGQLAVAVAITRTPGLLFYLPVLLTSGILAGLFTGLGAQHLAKRLPLVT